MYIAGIIVGNKKIVYKKEITRFLDGMTTLVQLIMFLSLGLLVNPEEMIHVIPIAVLIGIFMIMVGRPASVFLTLLPFKNVNIRSKLFVSWVGLRGAVPIIFATYPVVAGIEFSDQIFNIVFVITLMSLIVQGMSITSIAKMLHLINEERKEQALPAYRSSPTLQQAAQALQNPQLKSCAQQMAQNHAQLFQKLYQLV